MHISIYLYIKFVPLFHVCVRIRAPRTPRRIYAISASIFSFLSQTSYVRINPYASLNDIPAYHVGILNATKADSRLGRRAKTRRRRCRRRRRRPSPPVNTYIRTCIYTVYVRREERSFLCSFCATCIGATRKRERNKIYLFLSRANRIKRVVSQRDRPTILSRFRISRCIHRGLAPLLSRSVIYRRYLYEHARFRAYNRYI